jgi:hypothetical protein
VDPLCQPILFISKEDVENPVIDGACHHATRTRESNADADRSDPAITWRTYSYCICSAPIISLIQSENYTIRFLNMY